MDSAQNGEARLVSSVCKTGIFSRELERAGRDPKAEPATLGKRLSPTPRTRCVCAARTGPWRTRRVERGERRRARSHQSSAPRDTTKPKEVTKGRLPGGSQPPNGSLLSCGA